ncbi:hypothetical protein, partial [Acetomicrobium sp. S15 = DSM 107314]|uniref:hypothetical protein n=1 Tax=Acetomicrobium sp. S15 = DSM 107314 TaxID=2529858 RepID=UPI001E2CA936
KTTKSSANDSALPLLCNVCVIVYSSFARGLPSPLRKGMALRHRSLSPGASIPNSPAARS